MLKNRIARLERRRPPGRFGVLRARPGESVEEAAARADAEGYIGALIAPHALDRDAWEAITSEQQAGAASKQAAWIAQHRIEPDHPPVVRRRTEAASPQPAPTQPKAEPRKSATVPLGRK